MQIIEEVDKKLHETIKRVFKKEIEKVKASIFKHDEKDNFNPLTVSELTTFFRERETAVHGGYLQDLKNVASKTYNDFWSVANLSLNFIKIL